MVDLTLPDAQKEGIKKRMWQAIRSQTGPTVNRKIIRLAWLSGIAASLLLGLVWFYTQSTNESESLVATLVREQTGIEVKNTNSTEQEVTLPDGTTVLLTHHSSLVYEKTFNQARREVYLKGEAFFKVKRDVTKPFVVHTGELVTEVLGTSFRIRENEQGKTTEVSVSTGKVSVYTQDHTQKHDRNGVIITPNQRVLYDANTHNITPGIVEKPVAVLSQEELKASLLYKEATFEKVLSELTQLYGIEFVISNATVKDCRITADLNGLSMFTQLELICKSIDATYEKRGTVVFIKGNGCQ
jgi:ferric-dicitrate binding protein FerR (iron transport regulator)